MDVRDLTRALAAGRVAVGTSMLLLPRLSGRLATGQAVPRSATWIVRGLGARDVVLGAGELATLEGGANAGGWALAGAAADAADAAAIVLAFPHLGRRSRWLLLAVAATAAVTGVVASTALDEPAPPADAPHR